MQEYLEKLLYFWAAITGIGLFLVIVYWAIATIIYVAFVSLFIAIVAAAIYQFYTFKNILIVANYMGTYRLMYRIIKSYYHSFFLYYLQSFY